MELKEDIKKAEERKPVKIFTLDTETRGLYGDIFRVGLYDGNRHYATDTFEELKKILLNYITKYECHVYIHNLDFDIAKMAKEVIPGANLKDSIFINNNVTVFKTNLMQQLYENNATGQTREELDFEEYPIVFHDSLKLIGGRLKNICRDFKLDVEDAKIDLTQHILNLGWGKDANGKDTSDPNKYNEFMSEGYYFENVHPREEQLNEYLRNDNRSLYLIVEKLIELSGLPLEDFLMCPTTASLAMKVYQLNYTEDYELATKSFKFKRYKEDEMKEAFAREGYYGGRTEVFQPVMENGFHYDVNSLYPHVMKQNKFPYGYSKVYQDKEADNMFRYWYNTKKGAGFIECDVHVPETLHIPPLPKKHMKKLCFPVGNLRGVWTFDEMELAISVGCKVQKIHQVQYYEKTAYLFKGFVSYFEEIKNTSDGAKKTFAKLMQNSLYGKFGMQRIRKTLMPEESIDFCEDHGYTWAPYNNPLYPGSFIEADIPSNAKYIQPHIAAYVTAHARILLYKGLMTQLKKGEVAYCDTDSIACTATMEPEMIDKTEYGKWSLDAEIDEAIFLQPKVYYEKYKNGEEIIKFKGIPQRQAEKLNRGVFIEILDRYKEIQRKKEAGIKISKEEAYFPLYKGDAKRVKFATTFKNGSIDFDFKQEISKGILLTNMQKRHMDFIGNTTRPLVVNDY